MLINCVAYREGAKLADIEISRIREYLQKDGCFVWVALKDASDEELSRMSEQFDLHPLAVEDARHGDQRPKVEEYPDMLFVVLHLVERDAEGVLRRGEVNIFVGKNYVLSVRNRSSIGFLNVRERSEREPELLRHGPGFVFYALMDAVVDRYFPILDDLEQQLELIEDRMFSRRVAARADVEDLYALKRQLMLLLHAASPLREALSKLHGGRTPAVCAGLQEYYRDVDDHLDRILRSIDAMREMVVTAMQVNLSFIALGESEVGKKLAAYGALFAVPTMIAGIYGMNFRHMPELELPFAYPLVTATMVGLDVLLYRRFRRAGWL